MNDLVIRRSVIRLTWEEPAYYDPINVLTELREKIKALPPAEPEIIRCKDCKHHHMQLCMDSMPRECCDLNQTFYDANYDFCSLAERRTDATD